ncbi:hypothetical protein [Nitratiruptor sp. YY09-18]|uniref:hypothetical protein n=1 Tax=Nitratiruptor sp. YY09-18 TaxID=2724901 RepID=UPI0019163728|nr:hypothetical protein [Nitratiruptor sp. YY09-18]BCD68322.1 hypothetical protein NitYY0918_C1233 [Nitratiruptor sp. YY09-18]
MKKLIVLLLSTLFLFASARYISPLPLPQTQFMNLDTYECNDYCLRRFLQNEQYFSFLAHLDPQKAKDFHVEYNRLAQLLHLTPLEVGKAVKITLIVHENLKRVATKSMKALLSYLLAQDVKFESTTKLIPNGAPLSQYIEPDSFNIIIATIYDKDDMANMPSMQSIYIPTLNKNSLGVQSYAQFGGIDYFKQLRALKSFMNQNVAIFYLQDSPLSQELTNYFVANSSGKRVKTYALKKDDKNAARYIKDNGYLKNASILFNTPLVKTAMIVSQMNYYNIESNSKFSTQINLNEKFFDLLHPKLRNGFFFANAIGPLPQKVDGFAQLIGENIDFNWIEYSTICGSDAILAQHGLQRLFHEPLVNGQLEYDTHILQATRYNLFDFQKPQESSQEF